MTSLLVIGYGNELCGDDGVGPLVARIVDGWGRPEVRAIATHQLTPELAAELATAERVVFVDAAAGEVVVRPVEPSDDTPAHGHVSTPAWLLTAARRLFGHAPDAWLITIPAGEFDCGTELSAAANDGVREALRQLAGFVPV